MNDDEEGRQEQATGPSPPAASNDMIQVDVNQQNDDSHDSHTALAYAGLVVSAIVLLISLTSDLYLEVNKMYKYGISVASIAMILGTLGWFLTVHTTVNDSFVRNNNAFLFVWCFLGACFMTFGNDAPFQVTGNGYFGAWGLAVFATMALGIDVATLKETATHNGVNAPTLGMFASSVVLLVAISTHGIHKNEPDFAELVYALVVSLLTIVVCAVKFLLSGNDNGSDNSGQADSTGFVLLMVFSILWVTAACLVTFRGPFIDTGNGYFGAWGGALTSIIAVNAARRKQA